MNKIMIIVVNLVLIVSYNGLTASTQSQQELQQIQKQAQQKVASKVQRKPSTIQRKQGKRVFKRRHAGRHGQWRHGSKFKMGAKKSRPSQQTKMGKGAQRS